MGAGTVKVSRRNPRFFLHFAASQRADASTNPVDDGRPVSGRGRRTRPEWRIRAWAGPRPGSGPDTLAGDRRDSPARPALPAPVAPDRERAAPSGDSGRPGALRRAGPPRKATAG